MAHPHVQELFRLVTALDLGPRRHAHLDGCLEGLLFRRDYLRVVELVWVANVHREIGAAPLHHLDLWLFEDFLQGVDSALLLDHEGEHRVGDGLNVFRRPAVLHVRVSPGGHAIQPAVVRVVRHGRPDAFTHLVDAPGIGEQDAAITGADSPLREERHETLIDLDHAAHVEQLGSAAHVVKIVKVRWAVFGHELHVVIKPRVSDGFDFGWPYTVDVCAERRLPGFQLLPQDVWSHVCVNSRAFSPPAKGPLLIIRSFLP